MLDGVVDGYLQGVTEREFDMPLMALLSAQGFYDIHKLHGAYEFGKDFIAKRDESGTVRQYAIQSKKGNINQSSWREIRAQIDEARYNTIAHPSFDSNLPRKAVLVTTGRLVGGAAPDAQQWANYLNGRNEISFEVWDQDKLRDWLIRDPNCGMADGMAADMLAVVAATEQGDVSPQQIERYTRRWAVIPLHKVAIEAAVIAEKLRMCRRVDLAAITALCVLRAARSQKDAPGSSLYSAMAKDLHASYATGLLHQYQSIVSDPKLLIDHLGTNFPHIAYSVVCHRLAEIWGLLALADHVDDETSESARKAVREIIEKKIAISRPISDKWAISLICATLSVFHESPSQVASLLREVIVWIADCYSDGPGLAPVDCPELEEIEYLIGSPLSHVYIKRRKTSYLAAVVLDLCIFFDLEELYRDAVHDFYAVDLIPTLVLADEKIAKWGAGEFGIRSRPLLRYNPTLDEQDGIPPYKGIEIPADIPAWDALALACLPRDRHPYQAFAELCVTQTPSASQGQ